MATAKQNWVFRGSDGTDDFTYKVPAGSLSEAEVETILQRLAARHLEGEEVIFASLRKGARGRMSHLDIHKDTKHGTLMTTGGTPYSARIEPA